MPVNLQRTPRVLLIALAVSLATALTALAQSTPDTTADSDITLSLPPQPAIGIPEFARPPLSPGDLCDSLAANANEPGSSAKGIPFGAIKPDEAVPACEAAVKSTPDEPRYLYNLARATRAKGDLEGARRLITSAVERGHVRSMLALATLFRSGRGGALDLTAAFRLVERAAATGDGAALAALASYHRFGIATPYDTDRWLDLLRQSATTGHVPALRQLGLAYQEGIGVPKNADIAEDLFLSVVEHAQPRAEQGIDDSMWVMGWAHENGAGVPRDYTKALAWYRRGEALNDTDSIASIGWLHDNGFGVPRDKTKACDYYERASKDGYGGILNNLGWCFATGEGRPLDLPRAKALYEQAIASGDAHAARNLGHMYSNGHSVPRDKAKAEQLYRLSAERGLPQGMADYAFHIKDDGSAAAKTSCDWFERAAQRHHARAMNNLAVCYTADNGPRPKNLATAITWYERAAALNDGLALRNLGDLFLSGTGVTKNETKALAYFKRGADAGDASSMVEYGMMLTRGQATTPDAAAGCDWFEKAAKAEDSRAMNNIGACFANGEGRSPDIAQGIAWYEKAMAAGDTLALVNLGDLYANGRGVTRDTKRAVDLFKRSAERGHPAGAVEYAAALFHGNGIDKDPVAACTWFEKAAQQNHPTGLNGLGVCVENGVGRKRDLKASMGWFTKAAEAGSLTALRNLVRYHDRGIAGSKNPEAAADWMRKAFERGHDSLLNDVISYPSSWSRDSRRALQKGLKRDGVYDGPVDGYMSASLDTALWSKLAPATKPRLTQEFVWAPIDGAPKGLLIRVCKSADAGNAQRPLVVINHGLTTDDSERRDMRPMSCGAMAAFFTQRGYTVAIPLRRGYGETAGRFTEGGTRVCATSPDFVAPGLAIATDIQAAVTHMKTRADIAPSGIIVLGHSGGGWGALALASRNAPGVAGIVNISGVHGSNRNRPEGVCGPDPITKSTRTFGRTARTPSLWIYGENDSHAGVKLVRRMFDGYRQGGASATLHLLPANDTDGHNIFDDDSFDAWSTLVDEWLTTLK